MEEQLLAAIVAEPDSDEPRLVYADWLIAQGDPRGEQIMQIHRGTPGLAASVHRDLLRALRIEPMQDEVLARIRVGFVDRLKITKSAFLALRAQPAWLDLPALRVVRELDVAIIDPNAWSVIRAWRHRGSIRRLEHGSKDKRVADGNLAAITTLLPQLASLKLIAPSSLPLERFDELRLEAFELEVRELDETALPAVLRRPWHLRMLKLHTWQYPLVSAEALAPLLRGDVYPGVRELELVGWKAADVVAALVASGRISSIDTLRMEWMPPDEILPFRDALAHIRLELPQLPRFRPTVPFAKLLVDLGRLDEAVRELAPAHAGAFPDYVRSAARLAGTLGRRDRVDELLDAIQHDHALTVVATDALLAGPLAGDPDIALRRARALAVAER